MAYAMNMQANFNDVGPKSEHALGDLALGSGNTLWIYGQASGAVAAGVCTIDPVTYVITSAAGSHTAPVAFADGDNGWVQQTQPVTPMAAIV